MLASISTGILLLSSFSASAYPPKAYPTDLSVEEGETDLTKLRVDAISRAKSNKKKKMDKLEKSPLSLSSRDFFGSVVWGAAAWFLSGSRSNPLVVPLANILYEEDGEDGEEKAVDEWLKDRNLGLYSDLPLTFLLSLGVIFLWIGVALDRVCLFLTEGDANICLQLGGVALINGAFFEIARIASGQKSINREEYDREEMLFNEFEEFAKEKINSGGYVHRSKVIKSFRQFNPKYRSADNEQYPLVDMEIERLVRAWARRPENGNIKMSSAGYFQGVSVADMSSVFT